MALTKTIKSPPDAEADTPVTDPPVASGRVSPLWVDDMVFTGRTVRIKTTGAVLRIDAGLLWDVMRWASLYVPVRLKGWVQALVMPGPKVAFLPSPPRPWYLLWSVAVWSGVRFVKDVRHADAVIRFEDKTWIEAAPGDVINGQCTDVSKSQVAKVFERIFGYPLALDPAKHQGPAVEKGEENGAHDGRIVECPTPKLDQRTYQRLIDNIEDGLSTDLRTPFVGFRPVVVYIKQRPRDIRFANSNSRVRLTMPQAVFTSDEIEKLAAFARAMKLDWGGMDVLRDGADGRLYVVDVNKTDMGPPLALPWLDKVRSLQALSRALKTLLKERS
ncbi:hypothetical protein [Asticcacaulis sp. AC402]|uniref:hypothetical protein n=1 Tax=Asticcacaulis sp. AC402 TaxID=1282361 RepID=UPI0003C3D02B|nr:hypothetical protein [Asticcacaulis sp. AC402]ESQ74787.1 hypothetical protein ABAC402_12845 [Asticcacaulis sp. AC402]